MTQTVSRILNTLPVSLCAAIEGANNRPFDVSQAVDASMTAQVETYIREIGDPRMYGQVVLPNQPHAAIASLASFWQAQRGGKLELGLVPFAKPGTASQVAGWFEVANFRHNVLRPHRFSPEFNAPRDMKSGYTVIDCRPGFQKLDESQLIQLAGKLEVDPNQINVVRAEAGQVKVEDLGGAEGERLTKICLTALEEAGVCAGNARQAQTKLLVIPPPYGPVATFMSLVFQGMLETWARTVRLAPAGNNVFVVAEVMDIEGMRTRMDGMILEVEAAKPRIVVSGNLPEAVRDRLPAFLAFCQEHGVEVVQN
jgi:hypothetical protein